MKYNPILQLCELNDRANAFKNDKQLSAVPTALSTSFNVIENHSALTSVLSVKLKEVTIKLNAFVLYESFSSF